MNFFTEMILVFFGDVFKDICTHIGLYITEIYTFAIEINQTAQVSGVVMFTTILGASLCGLSVTKKLMLTYGAGTEGDADQDSFEIIYRLCIALGAMGANTWMFEKLTSLTKMLGNDLIKAMSGSINFDLNSRLIRSIEQAASSETGTYSGIFCCGIMILGLILFTFTAFLRGCELTLSKVLLPIFALDYINTSAEKWKMFIFQYFIGFFSFVVQMFCFQMYLNVYQATDIMSYDIKNLALLFGWLILSIRSPAWLEKYIYATGVGRAVSNGAGRLGQVLMFSVRM